MREREQSLALRISAPPSLYHLSLAQSAEGTWEKRRFPGAIHGALLNGNRRVENLGNNPCLKVLVREPLLC